MDDDETTMTQEASIAAEALMATLDKTTSSQVGRNSSMMAVATAATTTTRMAAYEEEGDDAYAYEEEYYERDPEGWLRRDDDEDMAEEEEDGMDVDEEGRRTTTTTAMATPPKRRRRHILQRADTPVISNYSSGLRGNKKRMITTRHQEEDDEDEDEEDTPMPPINVASPWLSTTTPRSTGSPTRHQHRSSPSSHPYRRSSGGSSHQRYRQCHEALKYFLRDKRDILDQVRLYQETTTTTTTTTTALTSVGGSGSGVIATDTASDAYDRLVRNEQRVDLEFLRSLQMAAWNSGGGSRRHDLEEDDHDVEDENVDDDVKEGNFWALLYALRKLGLACLIWNDDEASRLQHRSSITQYLNTLAMTHVHLTPDALLKLCYNSSNSQGVGAGGWSSPSPPLALRRRRNILLWLEECFRNVLPPDVERIPQSRVVVVSSSSSSIQKNGRHLIRQGLYATDRDAELFRHSLALILAGQLDDALQLARNSGASWRAATWGGGRPHGYETDSSSTPSSYGNPARALWRRMTWKLADQLHQAAQGSIDEAAIAALLSSNVLVALDNASLRTWEKGLVATFKSMMDRMEDELLHQHNNHRRMQRPPFPGTEFERMEAEHLAATTNLAELDETGAVQILDSSPFEEMQCMDPFTKATACFLVGRSAILDFLEITMPADEYETWLRFATHLALYLDSVRLGLASMDLEGVAEWKNELLLQYVHHLASREDLWYMVVLYASLLPEDVYMDKLPALLQDIVSPDERKIIVEQLREYLSTESDLDLEVLRRVIKLTLSRTEDDRDLERPTALDKHKMRSILWLCLEYEHAGDALIAANTLVRQFFLDDDKEMCARFFIDEVLPEGFLEKAKLGDNNGMDGVYGMDGYVHEAQVDHALSEHVAFVSYLDAKTAVAKWKTTINGVAPVVSVSFLADTTLDKSKLNATEASIATNAERRRLIEAKRQAFGSVIEVAGSALTALRKVLEHRGGWLLTEDEVTAGSNDDVVRRKELDEIRRYALPNIALLYHGVCVETSNWVSECLNDAAEKLGGAVNTQDAIRLIDDGTSAIMMESGSLSPISPRYWTQKALELAHTTQTDTYKVWSAFDSADRKELLARLAEASVSGLMYAAP